MIWMPRLPTVRRHRWHTSWRWKRKWPRRASFLPAPIRHSRPPSGSSRFPNTCRALMLHRFGNRELPLGGLLCGWALGENSPDAATSVSIAKMYASDAGRTVGTVASRFMAAWVSPGKTIFTCFYRRAKASETAFGGATFHRERIASMVIDSGSASAKSA